MKPETAKKLIKQTRSAYNAIAEDFSRTRLRQWPALSLVLDYVDDGNKVLDFGCGNGRLINILSKKKINYLGIDNSRELVEIARHNFPGHEFRVGDITNLYLKSQFFDAVLMIAILHHIPSKELRIKALKNIYRVLNQGGRLIMTNWNLGQSSFLKQRIKYTWLRWTGKIDLDKGDILRQWGKTGNFRYIHMFTVSELERLARECGFKIIRNQYVKKDGSPGNRFNAFNIFSVWQKE